MRLYQHVDIKESVISHSRWWSMVDIFILSVSQIKPPRQDLDAVKIPNVLR